MCTRQLRLATEYRNTGSDPFPGVMDMFGTAGGLMIFRAALLAFRGFAALSLAYFDYEDLSSNMDLQLEYFEVRRLSSLKYQIICCLFQQVYSF